MLEQVKSDIGFENLSQDWDCFSDPVVQPMQEHQLSGLEVCWLLGRNFTCCLCHSLLWVLFTHIILR